MDSIWNWIIGVQVFLFLFRKYREYKWGYYCDYKSLKNEVFIVTGGNSGLGKETVKELVSREATVIMACRDMEKAQKVISGIRTNIKCGDLIPLELDLASFSSIIKFSEEVKSRFPKIKVLINNAGVSVPIKDDSPLTPEGFEVNFGINHLGHFLLTNLLIEKLQQSAPSRIVIVSSKLHERGKILLNDHQNNKNLGKQAYNNSKLANIYFCRELAKRYSPDIETFAVCPGFCYTGLARHTNIKWYHYLVLIPTAFLFMRSAQQGCQTTLYCALSDDVIGSSGKIFRDCDRYESSFSFDDKIQSQLWDKSESLTKLKEFKK